MKNFKTYLVAAILGISIVPTFAFAQTVFTLPGSADTSAPGTLNASSQNPSAGYVQSSSVDGGVGADDPRASNFQLVTCTGVTKTTSAGTTGVTCDFNQLVYTANRIIKFLLYLAIPLVTGMVLYTGWLYLTANGDTGQLEKAKKMFIPVILGMFWIGASYILVYTVIQTFVNPDLNATTTSAIKLLGK